jgi:hypothetical protein
MVNEKTLISVRAHKVILDTGMMNDNLIETMFRKFENNEVSNLLAYRICSIIENNAKRHPFSTIESFVQITKLLPFCNYENVIDLFRFLSSSSVEHMMQTRFLQCIGAPRIILNLLKEMDGVNENAYRIVGLYKLIQSFSKNEFLILRFQTDSALSVITKEYDHINKAILNQQWLTILSLFDVETVSFLEDIIPRAVDNIRVSDAAAFYEYQVVSIDLLTNFVDYEDNYLRQLFENEIPALLMDAMEAFPLHTILHQSITRFIKIALKSDMVQQTVDVFFDFIVDKFENSTVQVLHSSCLYMLKKIYSCEEGKEKIKTANCLEEKLKPLFDLIHTARVSTAFMYVKRDPFF